MTYLSKYNHVAVVETRSNNVKVREQLCTCSGNNN